MEHGDELNTIIPNWRREYLDGTLPLIDKRLTHKTHRQNVHVSRIKQLHNDSNDIIVQFYIDQTHPYFFEHQLDHVPGLMLIESARQFAIAASHICYDVPLNNIFIINDSNIKFYDFAELNEPLFGLGRFTDFTYKRKQLTQLNVSLDFLQGCRVIGNISGTYSILKKEIMKRIRTKAPKTTALL